METHDTRGTDEIPEIKDIIHAEDTANYTEMITKIAPDKVNPKQEVYDIYDEMMADVMAGGANFDGKKANEVLSKMEANTLDVAQAKKAILDIPMNSMDK